MELIKGNETIILDDKDMISGYKNSGYVEHKNDKSKKKTSTKKLKIKNEVTNVDI